jgi:signal transduction histidine kinase
MNNATRPAYRHSGLQLQETIGSSRRSAERTETVPQELPSEKLAELRLLAAGLAHEVRNSLAVVTVAIEVLERDFSQQSEKRLLFEEILRRLHGVTGLVGDLLEYAKPLVANKQLLYLVESLNAVLSAFEREPQLQRITVVREFKCNPALWADPKLLERLFLNLSLNAAQAMEFRGELRIRVVESGKDVLISFIDQGCGMETVVQESVFEPFFTTKANGSGLGLFLCKKYAEAHDGSIDFRTEPGAGSTFTVLLPRRPRSDPGRQGW